MTRRPGTYEHLMLWLRWTLVGVGVGTLLWNRHDPLSLALAAALLAYTGYMQWVCRRPVSGRSGYYVLGADLAVISALIYARGGGLTDLYNLYYLAIVQAAVLFSWRESMVTSVTAGLLYVLAAAFGPVAWPILGLRVGFFILVGAMAGYLADAVKHERLERETSTELLEELRVAHENLRAYAEEIGRLAVTDGLTNLYNHTYFQQRLDEEVKRAERYSFPLAVLMVDIDNFKEYNDTLGHVAGNGLLKELADILKGAVREVDIVARYGGEEFTIILPETDGSAALTVAQRIRRRVEEHPFVGEARLAAARVTVSIGAAGYPSAASNRNELIERADQAMYAAKRDGRNRVALHSGTDLPTQEVPPADERKDQPGKRN